VGVVLVTAQERYKGGSRLHFVCGVRALEVSRQRRDTLARIAATLSTPPEAAAEAVEKAVARAGEAEKATQVATRRLLEFEAQRLGAGAEGGLVRAHLDGFAAADLRLLAQKLLDGGAVVVALGSSTAAGASLILGTSREGADLRPALAAALPHFGGKGGGQPRLVQGTGPNAAGLDAALSAAVASLPRY
jgi:alanyl-tRNA synthetase